MHARFKQKRELGIGGFGTVWLAHDTKLGRDVAVKMLHKSSTSHLKRLSREAKILKSLADDPYVVRLLDYDLSSDSPYLVLEYCAYGSLRAWVAERRSWEEVAHAVACASRGLQKIHAAGGFHRDIKPDNLLLADGPRGKVVKVADFGVARIPQTKSGTMTRSGWGTAGYLAPEVLRGEAYTAAADVFSLGVTASELLTGTRRTRDVAHTKVPEKLRTLIVEMTDPLPERRPEVRKIAAVLGQLLTPPSNANGLSRGVAKTPSDGTGFLFAASLIALVAILVASDD